MTRRNPYKVGGDLEIYLRSASGKFSNWSKAKSVEIRRDGLTLFFYEFDRVNVPASLKKEITDDAVREIFSEETEYLEEVDESLEEIEEVAEVDPALAEQMYEDLLKTIQKEDPELFTSITGILPEKREVEVRREDFDFLSQRLGLAIGEKFWGTFDKPISISSDDKEGFERILRSNLSEEILDVFNESIDGENKFILRITYETTKKINGKLVEQSTGYGIDRFNAETEEEFKDVIDWTVEEFGKQLSRYLSLSASKEIKITGFTLENVIESEEG